MTTSHRPQLEARSGAKAAAYTPTSIEHARLLPGHTKLKYRNFKQDTKSKESSSQGERSSDENADERQMNEDEQDTVEDENLEESEDDQEDLLKELAKIQEAKLDKKIRLQQKEEIKNSRPNDLGGKARRLDVIKLQNQETVMMMVQKHHYLDTLMI